MNVLYATTTLPASYSEWNTVLLCCIGAIGIALGFSLRHTLNDLLESHRLTQGYMEKLVDAQIRYLEFTGEQRGSVVAYDLKRHRERVRRDQESNSEP